MHTVTLIPGEGIGPEISEATKQVVEAAGAPIRWETAVAGDEHYRTHGVHVPEETLESVWRNKVVLKGPLVIPPGGDLVRITWTGGPQGGRGLRQYTSPGNALRREFGCYANVRRARKLGPSPVRSEHVDIITVRELTEGIYSGHEFLLPNGTAVGMKIISEAASERIVRHAFQLARDLGRRKVTAVHKANNQQKTDGLFLEVAGRVAREFPDIDFDDRIIDAMCAELVRRPEDYDVLVAPNLYGDILSDLAAGVAGSLGMGAGINIGPHVVIFEAVHGAATDIAGTGRANPTGLMLSAVQMLQFLGEHGAADRLDRAIVAVYAEGTHLTADVGGDAGTADFTRRVIHFLNEL